MLTNLLGDLVLGSWGLSQALGKPSRGITRPAWSRAAPGVTKPKKGTRGMEQGRQEASPERADPGPGCPRGPPECDSGPHRVPAAPGALACYGGRCAQGEPRAFPCLEKHLVLIVVLEKDENSPGATRREGRARWAGGLTSSPCAAGPARPKGCLQGPQHAPSPPRRSAETPSLLGTQAPRGCRPGLLWLLTPGREGVLSCVRFLWEEVLFPLPAGSSSQGRDQLPSVTGPWGVCGDGGVCGRAGQPFRPQRKTPTLPSALLLLPSLLLVVPTLCCFQIFFCWFFPSVSKVLPIFPSTLP